VLPYLSAAFQNSEGFSGGLLAAMVVRCHFKWRLHVWTGHLVGH